MAHLPPRPPDVPAPASSRASRLGWGALVLASAGTLAYVALLGVPWSRESGVLAFVPQLLACGMAVLAWRGDRRLVARLPAALVGLLTLAFAWTFFVVARLPAPGTFETLARAPDVRLAQAEGGSLTLSEAAARGPVLLVFFRGHW